MFQIPCIGTDENHVSVFTEASYQKHERGGKMLSDQIKAKNFRLRESQAGYFADWHLAGDPTLIVVQKGILRISLRNGEYKDFRSGEMFVAADNLPENIAFDNNIHGHRAEVVSGKPLMALHIKLEDWV